MIDKHRQELLNQYDDAAFALLMDEYAEEEGALLLKEFNEAMASGNVPEIPQNLDRKCRQVIQQNFAKQRNKDNAKKILRLTGKAAVYVFVLLGLSLTTILSVEALRIPFLNYFIQDQDRSSVITFTDQTVPHSNTDNGDPLEGLLPDNYVQADFENNDGMIYSVYTDDNGNFAMFDMSTADGKYFYDSEDATCTNTQLLNFEAIYRNAEDLQMIWIDEEKQIVYSFSATEMTESNFLEICNSLALHLKS